MTGSAPGQSRRFEVRLPATRAGFIQGFDELRHGLDAQGVGERVRLNLELVFEELVANVIRHGRRPDHETYVSVTVTLVEGAVEATFQDDGLPFDPRERLDPEPAPDLEHASVGGRGLMLVRRFSSGMEYARTPEGQNRLTVRVSLDATSPAQMSESARAGG
jgi:anti-sigma regulatory factor (Ser/Thr protein kinase)